MILYFNKKKIAFFLILIFSQLKIFAENEIFLKPVSRVILYNNINTDELNPFIFSTKKLYIDETSTLKLIDEYEFSNGFYGDILKVKVVDGFYKNESGYLYEENTVLYNKLNKKIFVFFKDKTYLDDYNILINKDTVAEIEKSRVDNGKELTKIIINNSNYKNLILELKDMNSVHYIINKFSEISYNLRKGKKVIKIVDSETLLPLKDAQYNENKSDEYGILYLDPDKNKTCFKIKKEGYTENCIFNKSGESINLALLNPVDNIRYYDDRTSVFEKNFYRFLINSRNLSVNEKIGISILSFDDLSIFSYPEIKLDENSRVSGGFYLCNIPSYVDADVEIKKSEKNLMFYHFDTELCSWIKINHTFSDSQYKSSNLKNGYYLLIQTNKPVSNFNVVGNKNSENQSLSKKFLRNRTGDFYKVISNNEESFILPADEYEFLYYDISDYNRIIQKKIYPNEKSAELDKIKEDFFKIKEEKKFNENQFSPLYYGLWQKRAIKVNDVYTDKRDILEFLSDMKIEENNIIKFGNDSGIRGRYELIDEKRICIYINCINKLVHKTDSNEILKINPSLFNSQLIIPAFYTYQVGILQISYDKIYFTRNMLYKCEYDQPLIKMESSPFFRPEFPQDEKSSKYKIFFVKED